MTVDEYYDELRLPPCVWFKTRAEAEAFVMGIKYADTFHLRTCTINQFDSDGQDNAFCIEVFLNR